MAIGQTVTVVPFDDRERKEYERDGDEKLGRGA